MSLDDWGARRPCIARLECDLTGAFARRNALRLDSANGLLGQSAGDLGGRAREARGDCVGGMAASDRASVFLVSRESVVQIVAVCVSALRGGVDAQSAVPQRGEGILRDLQALCRSVGACAGAKPCDQVVGDRASRLESKIGPVG